MYLNAGLSFVIVIIVAVGAGVGTVRLRMLREQIRKLEAETVTDPLTGAFNRRHLDACLVQAMERRNRLGESASLLLFAAVLSVIAVGAVLIALRAAEPADVGVSRRSVFACAAG